jgi:hypothetical protein
LLGVRCAGEGESRDGADDKAAHRFLPKNHQRSAVVST